MGYTIRVLGAVSLFIGTLVAVTLALRPAQTGAPAPAALHVAVNTAAPVAPAAENLAAPIPPRKWLSRDERMRAAVEKLCSRKPSESHRENLRAFEEFDSVMGSSMWKSLRVPPPSPEPMELSTVWLVRGTWEGLATDARSGAVFAYSKMGVVVRYNEAGVVLSKTFLDLPESDFERGSFRTTLRLANLADDGSPEILLAHDAGRPRTYPVTAFDLKGDRLWRYEIGQAPDDVRAASAFRDPDTGFDPVIVGYNGDSGVHLLNSNGTVRWINRNIGNVWTVASGRIGPGGEPRVITTAHDGQLHAFGADGAEVHAPAPDHRAYFVAVPGVRVEGGPALVIADSASDVVTGLREDGSVLWKSPVPGGATGQTSDGTLSEGDGWLAIVSLDGLVVVYDLRSGETLASAPLGARHAAWCPRDGGRSSLLVVDGFPLRAMELRPRSAPQRASLTPATTSTPPRSTGSPPATPRSTPTAAPTLPPR